MIVKISISPAVAATSSGTRRRTCLIRGQQVALVFDREPRYLHVESIPPELAQDPHLIIKEVTEEEMRAAGGTLTELLGAPSEQVTDVGTGGVAATPPDGEEESDPAPPAEEAVTEPAVTPAEPAGPSPKASRQGKK